MKQLLYFFCIVSVFISAVLYGCASTSPHRTVSSSGTSLLWVNNHPYSKTHFIGIGSSKIGEDLQKAQKQARNRALNDIAEQINVTIESDIRMHKNIISNGKVSSSKELYQEKIQTFTRAMIAGWEERRTWNGPDGYFWSKVILSKKRYYEQVNRKIIDAVNRVCDIISRSMKGSARYKIHTLYKGFEILDTFPHVQMKGIVNGKEVILNNELQCRMSQVLESIVIKPVQHHVTLSATESIPATLGVYVFCEGKMDSSLAIAWSASDHRIIVRGISVQTGGLYPVSITSLPPSTGCVTITAIPDLKKLSYDLIRRKHVLPSASFTISRERIPIYIESRGSFCRSLAEKLAGRSAIIIVDNRNDAEYLLKSDLVKNYNTLLHNSIYMADAYLELTLLSKTGNRVVTFYQKIRAADGISASRALENTQKYALDLAVKQVERAF